MRIIHILNHTRRLNGNVHAAIDLACAQVKLGHDVLVVSGGGDFDRLLAGNKVAVERIDQERKPLTVLKALPAFRRLVKTWKPDIVHAHMMTSAVLAFPVCRLSGIPLITTVHNAFEKSAVLMGLGNRVVAVSEAVGQSMRERGIAARKLHVVLNGTIGSARFDGRSRTPAQMHRPNILFVGGLHPRKGLPDLLEAFRLTRQAGIITHLYIAGGGPFETEYRRLAEETGHVDAITFIGAIDEPFSYMMGADIFVLPSHADPAPLVLSEAREAGCAVIGADVDGIPQLLGYGEAGMLTPPRDPQALASLLIELLSDPRLLEVWKSRSQLNLGNLTIERVARETFDVYKSAMPFRARPTAAPA
ncbi:glycosyltransferase involved in cell wall biosynthesis [Neorhizobium sp. 2083]|uniref:glycosyltransferase family 4 protein n=1 Tax=Neorhizobium sp. 2083 TaxID=2817762 RepID=UPI00285816E9|nr:glycosyltransferase family 4 protein [Neorhizobium sp. 2083]MDR6817513.1 glycosyltransferase involved in cell wall biosynthesis [Neorhizobium sp. 2083]